MLIKYLALSVRVARFGFRAHAQRDLWRAKFEFFLMHSRFCAVGICTSFRALSRAFMICVHIEVYCACKVDRSSRLNYAAAAAAG